MEYLCDFCNFSFKGKGYLLRHMEQLHLKFTCTACNNTYSQKRNFLDHLRSHFEKFICNYCGIKIYKSEKLEQHILNFHEPFKRTFPFQCRFCERKFPNAVFRNCHERDVHKGRDEHAFKCRQCEQVFLKKDQLRLHTLENHYQGSIFICPYKECDRYFKTSKLLRIHEKIHGSANFQCKECHKTFQQSSNYSKHKKRCKGPTEIKNYTEEELEEISNMAEKQFFNFGGKIKSSEKVSKKNVNDNETENEIQFVEELQSEIQMKETLIKVEIIKPDETIKKRQSCETICDACGLKFDNLKNLRKHMMTFHIEAKTFHLCPESDCNLKFKLRGNLVKHMKQVHLNERPYQCDKCPKLLKAKHHLINHLKIHGSPQKCPICGIILPNIEAHIKRHQQVKTNSFVCGQCNRECATKQALNEHIQRIHERKLLGKFYTCKQCGENFIRNSDLRRHSFVHYQGKIFSCTHPGCPEMFKNLYKLKLHEIVHNKSAVKNFVCETCNKSYPRQTALYKHKKSHT